MVVANSSASFSAPCLSTRVSIDFSSISPLGHSISRLYSSYSVSDGFLRAVCVRSDPLLVVGVMGRSANQKTYRVA